MIILSDIHLGTKRQAHTTNDSRKRLAEAIYIQANEAVSDKVDGVYILGDLFDRFSNDESVLLEGFDIASRCRAVMAGNHDMPSRAGIVGTFSALHELLYSLEHNLHMIESPIGVPYVYKISKRVSAIPHVSNQDLFEQSLKMVEKCDVLLLHCNYNNDLVTESDTSLNLTEERADWLLSKVGHIFIGHEHCHRELHDGRVIIVGSPHPTSFSDISDKYLWRYDEVTKEVSKQRIWNKDTGYLKVDYEAGMASVSSPTAQFIEVVGTIGPENGTDLNNFINDMWKANSEALMIKNSVEISDGSVTSEKVDFENLAKNIENSLAGSDLEPLWRKYSAKVD